MKSNDILFSIICPIYNAESMLNFSIESIRKQNQQNWELILVDDGSTDNSGKICDELQKQDKRIRVIHKKNEGQAQARLDGVLIAKGDYLLFLDSDDKYEFDALTVIANTLAKKELDLIVFNAKKISEQQSKPVYVFDSKEVNSPMIECFCKRRVSYFWTICIKRDLLLNVDESVKKTFVSLRYSEDFYLIYNIIKNVKNDKFAIIDKELYCYLLNQNSITNTQNASKLMDRFFVFNYVYENIYINYHDLFELINKTDKESAGWTSLSAARKVALEYNNEKYSECIKTIRSSFLFNHLSGFKKDKYNFVAYIFLKLKMYQCFKKYIIKHESNKNEN